MPSRHLSATGEGGLYARRASFSPRRERAANVYYVLAELVDYPARDVTQHVTFQKVELASITAMLILKCGHGPAEIYGTKRENKWPYFPK
ncbi:MAG: hypothetical protein ABEJ78_05400 [Haloferacaceae archaeon]